MFKSAFLRLFLILFPLSLFFIALFITNYFPSSQIKLESMEKKSPQSSQTKLESMEKKASQSSFFLDCPFFIGVSFFSSDTSLKVQMFSKEKHFANKKGFQLGEAFKLSFFKNYVLSKKQFVKKLKNVKKGFKQAGLDNQNQLFVFPIALTKDNQWIVSKKSFFLLPSGERKEISHLDHKEIVTIYRQSFKEDHKQIQLLTLDFVFQVLSKANFLFYVEGSDQEKIRKNLSFLKNKTPGQIYLSSYNEKLLNEMLSFSGNFRILHTFKSLIKSQLMSVISLKFFETLSGQGLVIPSVLSPSLKTLNELKNQGKILFFEKDPPFAPLDPSFFKTFQAVISSRPLQALNIIKNKKPCLIQK